MGKNQHSKDKLFVSASEHAASSGGFKAASAREYARLPFTCCSLTFARWETPVAAVSAEGAAHIFEFMNIVPWIRSRGTNPVTGEPLAAKALVRLKFSRNADGEWACPVTGTRFGDHTRIVALRTTGNVYSGDAIEQLCAARKSWRDLLDDSPCTRADVLVLQDVTSADW